MRNREERCRENGEREGERLREEKAVNKRILFPYLRRRPP